MVQVRVKKAVDRRQTIAHPVGQAGGHQRPIRLAELDQEGLDRTILDHRAVIVKSHQGHIAAGMAGFLIARE